MDINLQMYLTDHRPQTTDHNPFNFEITFKTQGLLDYCMFKNEIASLSQLWSVVRRPWSFSMFAS